MNNFIIKSDKTKDIDRSGYYENINISFKSTIIDIPMFIFDAEGETTAINSFLVHKIDPITHEICNTITLDSTLIKLHANGYFYLDKINLSVLFDVDAYYYLEISNGNKTWNSQIFQTLKIPIATLTINSFVANDYIQGLDTELSATFNATATGKGLATFNFTWDFGSQQVTTTIQQSVSVGDTVILNPTASAPSGVTSGSYTLTVSGSVSGSDTFNYIIPIVIETNITDYTTQTTGINLAFTGNVIGKWIDQPSEFNFVSSTENIRTYTANGTYNLLIYGDLANITEIRADNSRISQIDFPKLSQITYFSCSNNDVLTSLNLSNVPVAGIFGAGNNPLMTSITFASTGNGTITNFNVYNNDVLTSLYLSNVPVSGSFKAYNNPLMTSITFASSGNGTITYFSCSNNDVLTSLDLSNVPISEHFDANFNQLMTSITFASSGNGTITYFSCSNNDVLTSLDLSNVPISGVFGVGVNQLMTSIIFASSGNGTITLFYVYEDNLTSNIDLGGVILQTSQDFRAYSNNNLTGFYNYTYIASSGDINISNCNFTQLEVDEWLQNAVNSNDTNKLFDSSGGTNAAPSSAGLANVSTLVSRGWTVNHN